jgi:hypothetical protein
MQGFTNTKGSDMTFDEWVKENDKVKEVEVLLQEFSLGDYKMDAGDVLDLMREAWDARYYSLKSWDL